jgi:hypothetical protein
MVEAEATRSSSIVMVGMVTENNTLVIIPETKRITLN